MLREENRCGPLHPSRLRHKLVFYVDEVTYANDGPDIASGNTFDDHVQPVLGSRDVTSVLSD